MISCAFYEIFYVLYGICSKLLQFIGKYLLCREIGPRENIASWLVLCAF